MSSARIAIPAVDYAQVLKDLSDTHFPNAAKIVLVQDNLNTHNQASLYEPFPAAAARQLVERFEWYDTPKHGSWWIWQSPNSTGQCLDRRILDKQTLIEEVVAWECDRNKNHTKADWQFTRWTPAASSSGCTLQYERLRAVVSNAHEPCPTGTNLLFCTSVRPLRNPTSPGPINLRSATCRR
jgi:hypothetical protein